MSLHPAITKMLGRYDCKTQSDYKNALKEIIQEVALLGLSRSGFFDHAAFYGGTSLRIAHQLDRFSEDLDFESLSTGHQLDLEPHLKSVELELATYGLNFKAEKKIKTSDSAVESAFLKGNTLEHLLKIDGMEDSRLGINKNDILKIKLEIDLSPPDVRSETQMLVHEYPIPFAFRILDLPSLFAGKLHAVLCRQWKGTRVKGRDFYDYLWYIREGVRPYLPYLESKMRQSGHLRADEPLDLSRLKQLLEDRFESIDWGQAKADVGSFIRDPFALEVWGTGYFKSTLTRLG